MRKIFNTIYYLYDRFVYTGIMGDLHPTGYSKEHAFTVFVFLQLINIITINNFIKPAVLWSIPLPISFSFAILLYFINRHLFFNKELNEKPSLLMIAIVIIYIIGSFGLMLLSFQNVIPK